ncbi:Protein of unknown function (DUF3537 [Striga hermonthica]|uniref:Uncharacterized protein n=1 Tax=Striga hermonthica TaxID=68872 RepID=A0A9N7NG42_STRHE|nr:Protein of unknown function (DUF3537 [Striga hermonthica]
MEDDGAGPTSKIPDEQPLTGSIPDCSAFPTANPCYDAYSASTRRRRRSSRTISTVRPTTTPWPSRWGRGKMVGLTEGVAGGVGVSKFCRGKEGQANPELLDFEALIEGFWVFSKFGFCPFLVYGRGCEKGQIKSFEIDIVISQACLAASSLICLLHNLRKYGVRKFLFVDRYSGYVERFSGQYVQKISESMRTLVLWVLACCLLKTVREIVRFSYVHHGTWWQSAVISLAFVLSWTYVTTIILSSCILFYVVCNLQIIHFDDYGKLLEREPNIVVLLQEHARLRFYLSKISHSFFGTSRNLPWFHLKDRTIGFFGTSTRTNGDQILDWWGWGALTFDLWIQCYCNERNVCYEMDEKIGLRQHN